MADGLPLTLDFGIVMSTAAINVEGVRRACCGTGAAHFLVFYILERAESQVCLGSWNSLYDLHLRSRVRDLQVDEKEARNVSGIEQDDVGAEIGAIAPGCNILEVYK